MHLGLADEELAVRDAARRIAAERLAPLAASLDRGEGREAFLANLRTLAEQGFMAVNVAEAHGGTGAGTVAFALSIEELAYACASTAVTASVTNMVAEVIEAVGSPEQRATHLPRLADGSYPAGSFCLTESGAGSDPSGMTTRARREGGGWRLDGEKLYVTSGDYAGLFVVWAVTNPDAPRGKGVSTFLVEAGTPGLTVGRAERKMGQHGSATNVIHLDDLRLPADALLGAEDGGYRTAVAELAGGRIGIAAVALGIARAAQDAAVAHAKERRQFGRPIGEHQAIAFMLADRDVDLAAARLLVLEAAHAKDTGAAFGLLASRAKLFASEAAARCTDTAIQVFGGAGYTADYPVERYARDARITRIYEGTSEIQRMIIARHALAG